MNLSLYQWSIVCQNLPSVYVIDYLNCLRFIHMRAAADVFLKLDMASFPRRGWTQSNNKLSAKAILWEHFVNYTDDILIDNGIYMRDYIFLCEFSVVISLADWYSLQCNALALDGSLLEVQAIQVLQIFYPTVNIRILYRIWFHNHFHCKVLKYILDNILDSVWLRCNIHASQASVIFSSASVCFIVVNSTNTNLIQ